MHSLPQQSSLPYFDIGALLLDCIFDALTVIVNAEKYKASTSNNQEFKTSDNKLRKCFNPIFEHCERGVNPQFTQGNTSKEFFETRVVKITLQSYNEVYEETKNTLGFGLPSPLHILYQILTVPEEPQSSAYSLIFCRTLLFETFRVFPEHPLLPTGYKSFNISQINSYLDNFYSYTRQSNNIPQTETIPQQLMLAHYLSLKGVFYFRFGKTNKIKSNDKIEQIESALTYLSEKKIQGISKKIKPFEFHKISYYEELPESATLINELSGIPIPLRGAETIFQGGLKTDSESNLVIRVSGDAGSGKTSFALALCAAMSPFNTFSYYMSLEEGPKDLNNRLYSLIPSYLKKLSIYNPEAESWFLADKIPIGRKNRLEFFETEYIDRIDSRLNEKKSKFVDGSLPTVCPFIIIIDSIRVLLNEENSDLERFIEKCKKLDAIIILISANDEKFHHEIDYLVDVVIHLKHSGTENQKEKPTRIFHLAKTRHQISRPGSHVFHLSGEKGFRISPQLPSQIDKKEKISKPTPSTQFYINFFNEFNPKKLIKKEEKLQIWDTSQILFHGYGSSGKAGLSLNILLSPVLEEKQKSNNTDESLEQYRRKVLVVSLLYPESYYTELKKKITKKIQPFSKDDDIKSKLECLYFYSGFLTPEDFISRILRKLDMAILEGEPFTGILLDGLHNVSLQFHKLQESDMVWPTLYSLLAKYRLTIITTFTNFVINNENKRGSIDDDEIILKGHKPLLHALVQGTDYHFVVRQASEKESHLEGKYIVSLKSAIRHKLKSEKYIWDREDLKLSYYEQSGQLKIFDLKNE